MPSQLSNFCCITMGQSPKGDECNSSGIGHPLLNGPTEFQLIHPSPVQWTTNPKKFSKSGDLLFCVRGSTTGRMNWSDQIYAIGRGLASISPLHEDTIYFFRGAVEVYLPSLLAGATGSTFPNVSRSDLESIPIPHSDLKYIKSASSILRSLERKIELNQKMNQTLEEIAETIFKSWFVDFDPVRAKAEGRPTGLPPEISDLFPDELVDSEIGEVPKGWEVKTISDLADCVGGATPSTKNPEFWEGGKHTWTSPKDLSDSKSIHLLKTDRKITEAGLKKISSGLLPVGTVLLSSRAPVGYLALTTEPTAINQGYIALKPKSGISNYFLLHWCESNLDEIKNRASGTTFAEISKAAFRPIPAIEPSKSAMEKFHQFVSPIYQRVLVASKEMETLAELRDTLLPKLISGELRIHDAEKFLEEAGL